MDPVLFCWHRQSRTEYMAAALTAQSLHWMAIVGLSPETLTRASRVVADEVRHSRRCRELYLHLGGSAEPIPVERERLSHADDPRAALPARLLTAVGELAVEESVAVPVFQRRLENARDPLVREVVEEILRDESFHRAFAWDVLDELVERLGVEVARAWVRPRLSWWVRIYATTVLRPDEPVYTDAQLAAGLIDRRDHWALMGRCVREEVLPRFERRGLLEAGVTLEALGGEIARGPDGSLRPPG